MNKQEPAPIKQSKYALPKKQNLAEVDLFSDNTTPSKINNDNLLDILGGEPTQDVKRNNPQQGQDMLLGSNTYGNYNAPVMGGVNNMGYSMNTMQNQMAGMNQSNPMAGMNQRQNMVGMNPMQGNMQNKI